MFNRSDPWEAFEKIVSCTEIAKIRAENMKQLQWASKYKPEFEERNELKVTLAYRGHTNMLFTIRDSNVKDGKRMVRMHNSSIKYPEDGLVRAIRGTTRNIKSIDREIRRMYKRNEKAVKDKQILEIIDI